MADTSFKKRNLKISIQFIEGDIVALDGYRVSCDIDLAGGISLATAKMKIFGLSQSLMNRLTTYVWNQLMISKTVVSIEADGSLIHVGNIVAAYADYSAMPDVFMYLEVNSQAVHQVTPIPVKTYPAQSVKVTDIVQSIANDMGLSYNAGNVDAVLYKPYFTGTPIDQLRSVCQAANIEFFILNNTLATTKKGTALDGIIHVITPESGLVGYPVMQSNAINLTVLFNPSIRAGGVIDVQSSVVGAQGRWRVASISHKLDSNNPVGRWFTDLQALSSRLYEGELR